MLKKTIYLLPLVTFLFSLSGCASHSSQSTVFNYEEDTYYGVVPDAYADELLYQETVFLNEDHNLATDDSPMLSAVRLEEGTFLAEEWEKPADVIEYKYLDDPKFYAENELPQNKGRLGNVIVKVPANVSKEQFLARLEAGEVSY